MPPRSAAPRRAASLASASKSVSATATIAAGITFSVIVNDASTSILPSVWSILRYTPTRPAYDGSALPPNGYKATCHSQPLATNPGESILVPGTARSVSAMNLRRTPRGKGIVCRVTERGCGRAIEERRCHMDMATGQCGEKFGMQPRPPAGTGCRSATPAAGTGDRSAKPVATPLATGRPAGSGGAVDAGLGHRSPVLWSPVAGHGVTGRRSRGHRSPQRWPVPVDR